MFLCDVVSARVKAYDLCTIPHFNLGQFGADTYLFFLLDSGVISIYTTLCTHGHVIEPLLVLTTWTPGGFQSIFILHSSDSVIVKELKS